MSREWSSKSTSEFAHRTAKTLHLLHSPPYLNTQTTPEEDSDIDNVGGGGADLRNVPDVDRTPDVSSSHVAENPDSYYPSSSYPPMPQSSHTAPQTTDAATSDLRSSDRHAQYVTLGLPVPRGSSTSALPSANFPSVASFPPTATTAEFPPSTEDLRVPSYYYGAYVYRDSDLSLASESRPGLQRHSYKVSSGQQSSRTVSAFLSSYSTMGVNLGSQLDPAQGTRPPSGDAVERLQIRRQQRPLLQHPYSPVLEGSEVQSTPASSAREQTSLLFNTTDPFHDVNDNETASGDHHKESESSEGRPISLLPPVIESPDITSPFRHSFQTHATAGSTDGSSLPPTPTTATPFPDQRRWAEVIQRIKTADNKAQDTDPTNSNVDRLSVEALFSPRDNSSSNASQSHFGNSQGRSNSSLVPPRPRGSTSDGLLNSASATSGSDSFTAFELMSFPTPPAGVPRQQGPATPGTRSPWVKGLTLPMPTNMATSRRSIRELGASFAPLSFASFPAVPAPSLSLTSPSTPSTPPSVPGIHPTFHVVKTPSRVVVTTHDSPVPTVAIPEGRDSWYSDSGPPTSPTSRATSPPLQNQSHSTLSVDGSIATNSVTPSYNRRISALIHATEQLILPSQDAAHETDSPTRTSEDADHLGALDRRSGDEPAAVVGVVRTASRSCRSPALLTRAPSSGGVTSVQVQRTASLEVRSPVEATVAPLRLRTEDSVLQEGDHVYLSTAPSPSSTITTVSPSISTPSTLKLSPSLRRQPPVREPGFFPESIDEVDDQSVSAPDVDRTGRGMTSLDIRGVDTRMGPKDEMRSDVPLYNEKNLPRLPYPDSRESRPLPPLPFPSPPLLPTVPPPAILSDADVQSRPDHSPGQSRRQESFGSDTLTRVSSLLSRLSKSTMPSTPTNSSRQCPRKSKRGTIIPPPLPPPPLPLPLTPSQMRFPVFRGPHFDEGLADHELVERASSLEGMDQGSAVPWQTWDLPRGQMPLPVPNLPLDEVHISHQRMPQQQAQGSSGKGYVHKSALSKANSMRSMFSNRSDRSRHRVSNHAALGSSGIITSMGSDSNGRFTELNDDEKRKRHGQMRALGGGPRRPQKGELILGGRGRNTGGPPPKRRQWSTRSKWIAAGLFLLALLGLIIGLVVILTRRNAINQASSCAASNATGRLCDIDKTCVCTSNVTGRCNAVARTVVDLIPRMNTLFGVNFTTSNVSLTLWDLLGDPLNDCSKQALLVDVAPGLAVSSSPNRAEFARAAILYSLMETESLNTTAQMRSFIAGADFSKLAGQDTPVQDDREAVGLTFGADGFLYNFASMTLRPPSISWKDNSQATGDQTSRVNSIVDTALDRMYSFSTASSTQRSTALQKYWTSVLQLPSGQLDTFLNALRNASIVLPFDATSEPVSNLMSLSNTTSFPPPAACYPGLSESNRVDIDTVETTAFGLPSSSPVTSATFDVGCFASRPTYGILNVLNLRQPFADGRQGLTIQASKLTTAAGTRAVLKAGEQLVGVARASALSARPNSPLSASNADPRQYGTLQHLNHVALAYLQSFPNATLAATAAQFIVSTPRSPPNSDSRLFVDTDSLLNIPVIEVSVFGQLQPADMNTFYSDFGGPQGLLFFGTQRGDVFRNWALRDSNDTIVWSTGAIAQTVVQEVKTKNTAFENVWRATLRGNLTTPTSVVRVLTTAGLFG